MKDKAKLKKDKFIRRQRRTRVKMTGTPEKPRLSVFRSLMHISAQAIDDIAGKTLTAISDKEIKAKGNKTEKAALVGEAIGKKLMDKKIDKIVFDKGAYKYHGRVKALAEGIRKSGVKF
ncbi:50S ribosomal protein L18 [Patescibacteria group bacterium]|nr:50S ribosomal protein L18 [Patescibacteria group bacterium]